MPLRTLCRPPPPGPVPGNVRRLLHEADRRIRRFQQRGDVPAFVPSDYRGAYAVLHHLASREHGPGTLFCEWGSGFGVVACLAALLDFDACGIETDGALVEEARRLAADFELPVEFVAGSFIPAGSRGLTRTGGPYAWLDTTGQPAHEQLGLAPRDFGVIFAYPWPDEEWLTAELFERHARRGAVLVTHHGGDDFRLRRKSR